MKKLLVLSLTLALVLAMSALVNTAPAAMLNGTTVNEITYWDQHGAGTGWNGVQEYQEVEPGAATGNTWDFRGMFYDPGNKKLYVVAGFDLTLGGHYAGQTDYFPLGDLFIKTGGGIPNLTRDGTYGTVPNSDYGTYNYAVTLTGTAYTLNDSSLLEAINPTPLGKANPYVLSVNGEASQTITVNTGLLGDDSDFTDSVTGLYHSLKGDYYAEYDLSFLGNGTNNAFYHLSYSCGNDGVNGRDPAVPLPGAFLLLGAGLVRLAGYARRKRTLA